MRIFLSSTSRLHGASLSYDWIQRLFIENADVYIKIMDSLWSDGEALSDGIARVLESYGIKKGKVLDLFCGNGRVAVNLARKGYEVVGVDISMPFIRNAIAKAERYGVSDKVKFIAGDARRLVELLGDEKFDAATIVWTSLGYYDELTDLEVLKQVRSLSNDNGVLIIADTIHRDKIAADGNRSYYQRYGDVVVLQRDVFDPINSKLISDWTILEDEGAVMRKVINSISMEIRIYTVTEMSSILRRAGWGVDSVYGDLRKLQQFHPSRSYMNIVARAI